MGLVIGLAGPAGSGKSGIADYLVREYGAKRYAFADPLKRICMKTLPFEHCQLYGTQAEKEAIDPRFGFSARRFITHLGTEAIRSEFGDNVWAELTFKHIERDKCEFAIIDDCRFVNEAKFTRERHVRHSRMIARDHITKQGGFVWKIHNPFAKSNADPKHQSEAEWDKVPHDDILTATEFGMDVLFREVDRAADAIGLRKVR